MTHKTKNVPKGLRKSTLLFFFSKNAYSSRFSIISIGGRRKNNFLGCTEGAAAAAREPRLQLWSRGCSYGSADAFRDPPAVPPLVLHALCSSLFDVHDGSCDHCRRYPLHFSPYPRAFMNSMNIKERAAKCVQNNGNHFE